jgi:cyclopropane fatty-acyl-phospholipid synthase-like methyltransferase
MMHAPTPTPSGSVYEDGRYLEQNPGWHEEDSPWKAAYVLRMMAAHGLSPRSVAEVGCGGGMILVELASKLTDARFTGYEISPQAYARCAGRASDRLTFRFEDLLQTGDRHDLLLTMDVVEHVEDYMGFLRGLRPHAGLHILHIPLDLSVQTVLRASGPLLHARQKVGHLHYFSRETALATLTDCGFEVVDWFYTHPATSTPGRAMRTRVAGWMRRAAARLAPDLSVRVLGGSSILVLCR